jgi:alpha-mannosidase
MHDHLQSILARADRVLGERVRPAVHLPLADLTLAAWHVDGAPVRPAEALDPSAATRYRPAAGGQRWGPPWSTTWFHLTGPAPASADIAREAGDRFEILLDLGWSRDMSGFQAEGLVYRPDGSVVKGLNPQNNWIPIEPDRPLSLYVEAAANPNLIAGAFRPTPLGDPETAGSAELYLLDRAEICLFRAEIWELAADLEVLTGLAGALGVDDPRRFELGYALEQALDVLDLSGIAGTTGPARAALADQLARAADPHAHRVSAVGHAHIDSAWLWPVRETVRKVARTVSNVVQLMDTDEDLVYAMSSAQQYAWLEAERPEVFERLAAKVAAGRFIPVGGMWVESDANLVGGEAMVRQFLYGKGYFIEKFGVEPTEVWLPDSFGYSAALPQIFTLAGCTAFLSQKLSWNTVNPFPHHTFWWEGIDGTRIFSHFPPADTYNGELTGRELAYAVSNFRDKGRATRSLLPFGFGDGGGGPTREMLARARRTADLAGSPRVRLESPAAFFAAAAKEYPDAPVWTGELYLEIHRGTYTTQARTKQGNRRCEHLLREAELWSTTAALRGRLDYPYDALAEAWRTVLLQQFHDILPGSSIAWVHRQAEANYAAVTADLEELIARAIGAVAGAGTADLVANSAPVTATSSEVAVPPMSIAASSSSAGPVTLERDGADLVLDNGILRVRVDAAGLIRSVLVLATGRDALPPGGVGNLLQLHRDVPTRWDAWDLDQPYRNTVVDLVAADALEAQTQDAAAVITVRRTFGSSTARQSIRLDPGSAQVDCELEIDWQESERVLKARFDIDVHTDSAAFETQFGHVRRPTLQNTSWDEARFEVWAHRFVHVAEPGFGVGLVNDSTYGHDVTRHARLGGGTYSRVGLSVLRAPRYPDPHTDRGRHLVRFALVPDVDLAGAAAAGYRLNLPPRRVAGASPVPPLVTASAGVLVEAVKLAEDRSGDLVLRLYEPYGARGEASLELSCGAATVVETDLLERPFRPTTPPALRSWSGGTIRVSVRPFQIVTLRVTPARAAATAGG